MAGAQDYLDVFFPQQQEEEALNPYDQMLQDYLMRQQMGFETPLVAQAGAISPDKYAAQNMQKQLENERDWQTTRDKFIYEMMQGRQESDINAAQLEQGERRLGLEEREYEQKYGNQGNTAELLFSMLDPGEIQQAFSGDPQALTGLHSKVIEMLSGGAEITPAISQQAFNLLGTMAQDDRAMSPEQLALYQQEQADTEAFGADVEQYSRQLNPAMRNAVRETVSLSQDPDATLKMLAANKGNREAANVATGMAHVSALYGPQGGLERMGKVRGRVGKGMGRRPDRAAQAMAATQAQQAKEWNAGPALNRSPEPVVQATQTWNQPGVVNPSMTPAQAFELMHSPEAALAASPNRPAPPTAKTNKPKPKPKTNKPKSNKAV